MTEQQKSIWCDICKSDVCTEDTNYPCQHTFWDIEYYVWGGCGHLDELFPEDYKDSVIAVLNHVGTDIAKVLKRSLESHQYYFERWFGAKKLHAYLADGGQCRDYGDGFNEIPKDKEDQDRIEEIRHGLQWLLSLDSGDHFILRGRTPKTAKFDRITAGWIEEWLEQQENK